MITDLRIGSVVAIQKPEFEDGFLKVSINCLGPTKCDLVDSEGNEYKIPYDQLFPIKITKRWLKNNEFNCVDEGEEESNYIHQNLPITYIHSEHKLFVYGHIFPIKVKYVHHFQNALIDCGIEFPVDLRESHYTQVEGISITNLLGGLKKSREFFDTNAAFGLSSMPKISLRSVGTAISGDKRRRDRDANSLYKYSFVLIDGIDSLRDQRRLAEYFYDHTQVDQITNRIIPCYLLVQDQGLCMLSYELSFRGSTISDIEIADLSEFISNFHNYVRGSYEVGLIPVSDLPDNSLNDIISRALFIGRAYNNILQNPGFDLKVQFYKEEDRIHLRCTGDEKEFVISDMIFETLIGFLENIHARLFSVSSDQFANYSENEFRPTEDALKPFGSQTVARSATARKYVTYKPYYTMEGPKLEEPELPQPVNINNEVEEVELPDWDADIELEQVLQEQGPAVADRVEAVNKELRKNNNKKNKKKRKV